VTLLESSSDTSSQTDSPLNRIYATDRLTGEQLLLESDHVIVATDPETAKALLRDGELCCVVLMRRGEVYCVHRVIVLCGV
jgi:hypothetical protein